MTTVAQLIACLQTLPQDLEVVHGMYSEYLMFELEGIEVCDLCEPRPDGWVQRKRPDMPTRTYVAFSGN